MKRNAIIWALSAVLAAGLAVLPGCSSGYSRSSDKSDAGKSTKTYAEPEYETPADAYPTSELDLDRYEPEPTYENPLWPTTHPDLLAIPEDQRWYNAASHIGSTCTVAGPVVNVYQATESEGMPIFVDIGEPYPSEHGITLVVWSEYLADFEEMLNAVDHGGGWLAVTGYLDTYNGLMQFNTNSYVEYTWWTGVR